MQTNKKGVSDVVSTGLIIFLVVASIAIVAAIVLNLFTNQDIVGNEEDVLPMIRIVNDTCINNGYEGVLQSNNISSIYYCYKGDIIWKLVPLNGKYYFQISP